MKFGLMVIIGLLLIGCESIPYLNFNESQTQSKDLLTNELTNLIARSDKIEKPIEKINEPTNFLFENDFTNRFFCMEDTCIKKIEVLNIINNQSFKVKNTKIELIYNGSCYDTTTSTMTTDDNGNIFIVNGYIKSNEFLECVITIRY